MTPDRPDGPARDATADAPRADLGHDPSPGGLDHAPAPRHEPHDATGAAPGTAVTPESLVGLIQEPTGPRDLTHEMAAVITRFMSSRGEASPEALAETLITWLTDKGQTLSGDDPAIWGMKVYRNITERRNAERLADHAQKQLDEAFEIIEQQINTISHERSETAALTTELAERTDEVRRLRLMLRQVTLLIDSGALTFPRDDAETRTIREQWRKAGQE